MDDNEACRGKGKQECTMNATGSVQKGKAGKATDLDDVSRDKGIEASPETHGTERSPWPQKTQTRRTVLVLAG